MPAQLPPGDSLAIIRKPTGPAREQALTSALERFGAGRSIAPADNPDGWVTTVRTLPAVEARYAPWPDLVDARLRSALEARGISQLYTHQAAALTHALGGDNVVITTPTASGKTLCYNAPVLSTILSDPAARAIYLFPTKALAQDQLAELHELTTHVNQAAGTDIGVFTYDGDTPQDARRAIRTRAHIVLTNPDMLHAGILPHHPKWAKLFENLRFVVVDELHAYRGVFGSHLANVLRRVQRVCRHYGSDPVFICSSATIANPRELAERLVEKTFTLIDDSGAPRGEKLFLFVNPPVVNKELGIRRSYLTEARRVAGEFLKRQLQLIVFCQSRLSTEILTTYLKDDFEGPPGTPEVVRGYRGGYLPLRRREIERGLREGQVRAVVATNALELGIDIGSLDVAVMAGYPGHDRLHLAARRPGGPAPGTVGRGARGQQRADRPVRAPQPVVLFRRLARARAGQPRQPAHPAGPPEVRRVRAAVWSRRALWSRRGAGDPAVAGRGGLRSPRGGRREGAVELDQRVVSGRRRQPEVDLLGQLRHRGHDPRRGHHRRDRLHLGLVDAAREGDLPHRGEALPGREARLRRAEGFRACRGLRLLHRRDHLHTGDDPGCVQHGIGGVLGPTLSP